MTPPENAQLAGYNGNGWFWKPIALFLIGAVVSMIGFVTKDIVHQRDFVTRAEAQEMVEHAPFPWIEDRKFVLETLKKIERDVEYMKTNFWRSPNTEN